MTDVGVDHCRVVPLDNGADPVARIQYMRHLFAYIAAAERLPPHATVLEIGTGEGYGGNLLRTRGLKLIGTDLSMQALRHAREVYTDIPFCAADGMALPFPAAMFDAIVSFQVVEHVPQVSRYLQEAGRVLKPGGLLILTTPNRDLRLLPFQMPWNPYQLREYTARGLARALQHHFRHVAILGVSAKNQILAVEKARVRQSPVRVYARMLLGWLSRERGGIRAVPAATCAAPADRLSNTDPRTPTIPQAEVEDFFLTTQTDHSLDLFAIVSQPLARLF
ncbi:MAG: class I SAM-dependent methyltransferase, partial [Actinomycetes bacterium]